MCQHKALLEIGAGHSGSTYRFAGSVNSVARTKGSVLYTVIGLYDLAPDLAVLLLMCVISEVPDRFGHADTTDSEACGHRYANSSARTSTARHRLPGRRGSPGRPRMGARVRSILAV